MSRWKTTETGFLHVIFLHSLSFKSTEKLDFCNFQYFILSRDVSKKEIGSLPLVVSGSWKNGDFTFKLTNFSVKYSQKIENKSVIFFVYVKNL